MQNYHEFVPQLHLSPWVECLWSVQGVPKPILVLPDGRVDLVFELADSPTLELVGVMSEAIRISGMATHFVGVRFRPGAASAVFGVDMACLADKTLGLEVLWKQQATELTERLALQSRVSQRLQVLEQMLGQLSCELPEPRITRAVKHIERAFGQITVESVAREVNWSVRHFLRRFTAAVGITPQLFIRTTRFQNALNLAQQGFSWNWIVAQAGFTDQSHLIREFEYFTGVSPSCLIYPRS